MKNTIMALTLTVAALAGASARAEGWVCETLDGNLRAKVFHHTLAEDGTRNAAVLVLSDPRVGGGRKTIATLRDSTGLLTNSGASYEAKVDLRFAESRAKGELIGGTRLGNVDRIALDVDFSYAAPIEAGDVADGVITVLTRDGRELAHRAACERFLRQ